MNEIPVSLFSVLMVIGFIGVFYTFRIERPDEKMMASMFTSIVSWINALTIINGNVTMVYTNGTTYNYIPVQSLPLYYLWEGIAVIMTLSTVIIVIKYLHEVINNGGKQDE